MRALAAALEERLVRPAEARGWQLSSMLAHLKLYAAHSDFASWQDEQVRPRAAGRHRG